MAGTTSPSVRHAPVESDLWCAVSVLWAFGGVRMGSRPRLRCWNPDAESERTKGKVIREGAPYGHRSYPQVRILSQLYMAQQEQNKDEDKD
jgi:hypothetical protein